MYPRARSEWLDAFVKVTPELFDFYKVTRLRWVHVAGQVDAETDGLALSPMRENMNYTAERMLEVYKKRLLICIDEKQPIEGKVYTNIASLAKALAHKPELTADVVYGGREGTPWMQGHLYIGRGPTQCTHLNGYKALQAEIARQPGGGSYDLIGNPDQLATDPELGVRATFANFQTENLWLWCDKDDCNTLSDALNTGNIHDNVKPLGLPRRQRATATAKAIWPADEWKASATDLVAEAKPSKVVKKPAAATESAPAAPIGVRLGDSGPEVERLQARLSELKFQVGAIDGQFGTLTKRALVAFQAEHELQPDGIAGPRTWEVLEQTAAADLGDRSKITKADLKAAGSQTIAITDRLKKVLLTAKGVALGEGADQYFDLGIADTVISKGEQVSSLLSRGKALKDAAKAAAPESLLSVAPTAPAHVAIMVCCGFMTATLAIAYVYVHRVQNRRVADARLGKNLSH
jgi:predicted chitinase